MKGFIVTTTVCQIPMACAVPGVLSAANGVDKLSTATSETGLLRPLDTVAGVGDILGGGLMIYSGFASIPKAGEVPPLLKRIADVPPTPEPRIFTSNDPLVGDLATRIDAAAPGRVVDVNRVVRDPVTGVSLTDLDIELTDAIIQVKSGAKLGGGVEQVTKSAETTGKVSFLYAPKLRPGAVAEAQRQGVEVFQTWDDLKARLGL